SSSAAIGATSRASPASRHAPADDRCRRSAARRSHPEEPSMRLKPRMKWNALLALLAAATAAHAQTTTPLVGNHLSPDSVRQAMAVPSHDGVRGRIDSTGYALHAAQMAKVWELAMTPPAPDSFGAIPKPGVAAV